MIHGKPGVIQCDPNYPGKIYFVESPSHLLSKQQPTSVKANGGGVAHRIVEEDYEEEDDYDSYLSQSEDDSLVKKTVGPFDGDQSSEDIDEDKLDFNQKALLARINSLKQYLPKY
jgi:hypothetical protein